MSETDTKPEPVVAAVHGIPMLYVAEVTDGEKTIHHLAVGAKTTAEAAEAGLAAWKGEEPPPPEPAKTGTEGMTGNAISDAPPGQPQADREGAPPTEAQAAAGINNDQHQVM